jgi:hypothetical protein
LESDTGADDVDDRIHGADFVEVDFLNARAMDSCLRVREPFEDPERVLLNPG